MDLSIGSRMACDWRRCDGLNLRGGCHKIANICALLRPMRIELNYQAETFDEAICQAIVAYLGKGMPPREIIDQLIARGFLRNPGNNALEDAVQRLAEMAEQMRRDRDAD
jgi:hypothetical protein